MKSMPIHYAASGKHHLFHVGHQHGHQQWVLTYLLRESQFRCKIPVWDILLYYSNTIIMFALQKINISIWTEYLIVYKMYAYTCTWVVMFQVFTSCSTRKKQEWAQCLLFSKLTTKKSQINLIIINTRIYLAFFFKPNSENRDVNVSLAVSKTVYLSHQSKKRTFFSLLSHFSYMDFYLVFSFSSSQFF